MKKNIFEGVPENLELSEEFIDKIINTENLIIKRIISKGHKSPKGEWYDQDKNESVLLIKGSARLAYEDGEKISLKEGDHINIPAHTKHRLDWTDPEQDTVWLLVYY